MPDPIAFMVMPFSRKSTGRTEKDVPAEVDFDALWEEVHQPVLRHLGYHAVRADRDAGALIMSQMIQRLAIADLVVADITPANADVYYEVGVRNAAMKQGFVLVSATSAQPVLNLDQKHQLRFRLDDGDVGDEAAEAARAILRKDLKKLVDGLPRCSRPCPLSRPTSARRAPHSSLSGPSEFGLWSSATASDRRCARSWHSSSCRRCGTTRTGPTSSSTSTARRRRSPSSRSSLEQHVLALGKSGDVPGAIGRLQQLIQMHGESAERFGLLGGRYKQLIEEAGTPGERRQYPNQGDRGLPARHGCRPQRHLLGEQSAAAVPATRRAGRRAARRRRRGGRDARVPRCDRQRDVLIKNAVMPAPAEPPPSLRELARLNACRLSDASWDYDVARLGDVGASALGAADPARRAPHDRNEATPDDPAMHFSAGAKVVGVSLVAGPTATLFNGGLQSRPVATGAENSSELGDARERAAYFALERSITWPVVGAVILEAWVAVTRGGRPLVGPALGGGWAGALLAELLFQGAKYLDNPQLDVQVTVPMGFEMRAVGYAVAAAHRARAGGAAFRLELPLSSPREVDVR